MSNIAQQVARQLLAIKAVKLSPNAPFTWASGILSPIYCDNRIVLSYPEARQIVKQGFVEKSTVFGDFDVVAGVATAGIPHGALLADAIGKPFIYVRDKAKGHGRQNQIEGEVKAGQKVLVIEDLISTGGSSIKAIHALKEAGCEVVGILAIFTYGFDEAVATFAAENIPMDTLSNYSVLISEALNMNYIAEADAAALNAWRENPKEWGK
jgi:orotate phosphoribosyltransferase